MTDEKTGTETLPDRLSTNPSSPFHQPELLERGVGVLFNGVDRNNVEEYCVSEGWVRLAVGKTVDRNGNAMTAEVQGQSGAVFPLAVPNSPPPPGFSARPVPFRND